MPHRNLRVLVVEDHELQGRMQVHMLAAMGLQDILSASDGRAAMRIINDPAQRVDVVISDLCMPDVDGLELAGKVCVQRPGISFIFNSAQDPALVNAVTTIAQNYNINLLGVLEKPMTPEKLAPLLAAHCQGEGEVLA